MFMVGMLEYYLRHKQTYVDCIIYEEVLKDPKVRHTLTFISL